jgi:hypothetical protein
MWIEASSLKLQKKTHLVLGVGALFLCPSHQAMAVERVAHVAAVRKVDADRRADLLHVRNHGIEPRAEFLAVERHLVGARRRK